MPCSQCQRQAWQHKIGRCAFCRYSASLMLLVFAVVYYYSLQSLGGKHVYSLAALMALLFSGGLSCAHWLRFWQLRQQDQP